MKSFQVIHTITSPYRIHMFNIMHEMLKTRGVHFHVHFMSNNTSHRPSDWSHSSQKIHFKHSFWPNIGPNLYGNKWHTNPGLIKHILKNEMDVPDIEYSKEKFTDIFEDIWNPHKINQLE